MKQKNKKNINKPKVCKEIHEDISIKVKDNITRKTIENINETTS